MHIHKYVIFIIPHHNIQSLHWVGTLSEFQNAVLIVCRCTNKKLLTHFSVRKS